MQVALPSPSFLCLFYCIYYYDYNYITFFLSFCSLTGEGLLVFFLGFEISLIMKVAGRSYISEDITLSLIAGSSSARSVTVYPDTIFDDLDVRRVLALLALGEPVG